MPDRLGVDFGIGRKGVGRGRGIGGLDVACGGWQRRGWFAAALVGRGRILGCLYISNSIQLPTHITNGLQQSTGGESRWNRSRIGGVRFGWLLSGCWGGGSNACCITEGDQNSHTHKQKSQRKAHSHFLFNNPEIAFFRQPYEGYWFMRSLAKKFNPTNEV